jgi:hypothetical protein
MTTRSETPEQLREAGIAALVKELGPVEAIEFLRLFDPGSGDYTRDRKQVLGNPTVDELVAEIKAWKSSVG